MKKNLTLLLVALTAILNVHAQNLLNETVYGFETSEYILNQNPDYISLSVDQAAVGDSALKIYCADYSTNSDAWQLQIGAATTAPDSAKVVVPAGDYYIILKVYSQGDAPMKFNTNINEPWKGINWDISSIEKDKWVTLQQKITLEDTNSRMSLKITAAQRPTSGSGTLYIDEIRLIKDEYIMDTIAGNYLDLYYYGFESGTENSIDGIFIPPTSDAYVTFETEKNEMQMTNKFALKYSLPSLVDLPKYEKNGKVLTNNISIQLGSKDELQAAGNAIVSAGEYTASINILVEDHNMKGFATAFNDNTATLKAEKDEWLNILWTIPSDIALGEWVTLEQQITLAMDYDTKITIKADQKDLVDTTMNTVFYIDNLAFIDYVEDTTTTDTISDGAYKEGNVLNEDFLGFEKAGEAADGWFPQKNAGEGYFFFPTDMKASGTYSLLLDIPAGTADVPANLKLQAVVGEGNAVVLNDGIYDLYLKVFIDENTSIKTINTNFSKDDIGAFKAISWDLRDVEKGKWVELHRIDTLPAYSASKLVVQTKRDSIDYSTNACKLYIDDIAAVFKSEYVPMPMLNITTPIEDSVFTTTKAAIQFKTKNFTIGTDGKMNYTVNGGTAMIHEADTAITLTDLSDGPYQVILELLDMAGASLAPIVADTINFTVAMPAALSQNNTLEISVYPNPAQERINVAAEVGSQIHIYNLLGVQLKTAVQVSDITVLDISDLNSGSYLLRTVGKMGQTITKIQVR